MHLLTADDPTADKRDWVDLSDDKHGEKAKQRLDARLRQLLSAERLVVLAGLGTSLYIRDGDTRAPTMADLWRCAQEAVDRDVWEYAIRAAQWRNERDDIELLLSRCQMALELSGDDRLRCFVARCERVIVRACRFVSEHSDLKHHRTFLHRIARRSTHLPRTQIFTTNYDLAFEVAASKAGFSVIDGFSHVAPQRFDSAYFDIDLAIRDRERAASAVDWAPNVFHLLKLHGSVDWLASSTGVERVREPETPLIVYPRTNKFEVSYQQPFLDLMARFQFALRRPETAVLVVGSGLRDRHIVQPLLAAVDSNVRMSLVIVNPDLHESAKTNPDIQKLSQFVRQGDQRITLFAATFEDLVDHLPDLVPPTEAERHRVRLEQLGS